MIRTTEALDLLVLSTGMSDVHKRAAKPLTPDGNLAAMMRRLWDAKPIMASVVDGGGTLVGVLGAVIVHPGVASTFMYATDEFKRHVLAFSHLWKDAFVPILRQNGVHRVHALARADDTAGAAWKTRVLGFEHEAVLKQWGSDGGDYSLHVLLLDDGAGVGYNRGSDRG